MKLQYLGDWRDAFKWDLLHWVCGHSTPSFDRLMFVPLLTPDDPIQVDGRIPSERFGARPFVHAFVEDLRRGPRDLRLIGGLGRQLGQAEFEVLVHGPTRLVPERKLRPTYWRDFDCEALGNSIVFLDPDNGFETKTNRGGKWVLHAEVEYLVHNLPPSSVVAIYQHRPRKTWDAVFSDLNNQFGYAPFACAAYDSTLAFVFVSRVEATHVRTLNAVSAYSRQHALVRCTELRRAGSTCLVADDTTASTNV
jgi:hypothetical protein